MNEQELFEHLNEIQQSLTSRLLATAPTSFRYIMNRTLARVFAELYEYIEEIEEANSVLTATGADLDAIISDRLIDGRRTGEYATGYITFGCNYATESIIVVPAGTICVGSSENGVRLFFLTTEEGQIAIGGREVSIPARAQTTGEAGNVISHFMASLYTPVSGIDYVDNPLSFSGGTDTESDDDLRQRYIDVVWINGRASKSLIENHINDVETVKEVKVFNKSEGDVQIVVDTTDGTNDNNQDIIDSIEDNIACGIVARGCLAATLNPTAFNVEDCSGGYIWVRPRENIEVSTTVQVTFLDQIQRIISASVIVPAGTLRGEAVLLTFPDPTTRATSVADSTYAGSKQFDVLIGMGTYPYLYNIPELVPVSVYVTFNMTDSPETDLITNMEDSIGEFLDQFQIGESLDWSDLFNFVTHEFSERGEDGEFLTGRQFVGIDSIVNIVASGAGMSISGAGRTIDIETDQRIEPGSITVVGS